MAGKTLHIWKFDSTGNDFILVDNRREEFSLGTGEIAGLCHRHFGAGADGLILLENHPALDFRMRYFNSDGKEASFCGNGGRAISGFASLLGIAGASIAFEAFDGKHHALVKPVDTLTWHVTLGLKDVEVGRRELIQTGSPHHVVYVTDLQTLDVIKEGSALRFDPHFGPDGCNVNFLEIHDGALALRTYERGVENETLSCGTGVTASAIFHHLDHPDGEYKTGITTRGGGLEVSFTKKGNLFTAIMLSGPTRCVFAGEYYL